VLRIALMLSRSSSIGRSTAPSTRNLQSRASRAGDGKWFRTKNRSVGISQSESDANGNSMFGGEFCRTIRLGCSGVGNVFVLPSKGATSTLGPVECRFDHTALAARPLRSAFGRTLAHTVRSWIDPERQQRVRTRPSRTEFDQGDPLVLRRSAKPQLDRSPFTARARGLRLLTKRMRRQKAPLPPA
jgi:hypothetical protein